MNERADLSDGAQAGWGRRAPPADIEEEPVWSRDFSATLQTIIGGTSVGFLPLTGRGTE